VGGQLWPEGVVPYSISMELPFEKKLSVMLAIEHWQKVTDIQFIEHNEKTNQSLIIISLL